MPPRKTLPKKASAIPKTTALLLDTNALIWLVADEPMHPTASQRIRTAQAAHALYVSPISAWEAGLAILKRKNQPNLLGFSADVWFAFAIRGTEARVVPITETIALEVALVPAVYGSGDPGDCFLIATARVKKLSIVTRDSRILELARRQPGYLRVIDC
jgi:PIN domain nuclease of toxin-antitoxin system